MPAEGKRRVDACARRQRAGRARLTAAEARVPKAGVAPRRRGLTARRVNDAAQAAASWSISRRRPARRSKCSSRARRRSGRCRSPSRRRARRAGHRHFGFELDGLPPGRRSERPVRLDLHRRRGRPRHRGHDPSRLIRQRALVCAPEKLHNQRERTAMAIKVGDKLPNATFRVMTAEGPQAEDHRRGVQGQEGRAVRGARRLHADLQQPAPAGLPEQRRRDQGQGRRHHRGDRRQRRCS